MDGIHQTMASSSAHGRAPNGCCITFHKPADLVIVLASRCVPRAGAKPIHKATIMPRGNALGMVSQLPDQVDPSPTPRPSHKYPAYAEFDLHSNPNPW